MQTVRIHEAADALGVRPFIVLGVVSAHVRRNRTDRPNRPLTTSSRVPLRTLRRALDAHELTAHHSTIWTS